MKDLNSIVIGRIRSSDILLLTKHLAVTLKSGLTLVEGLEMLEAQSVGKLKKVLGELLEILRTGQAFHVALSRYPRYFSSLYINLVKTGEASGTLEESLHHLAKQLKKAHDLSQKIKSAMMYPLIILVAVVGLGFSVAIFVLPQILPLFRTLDVELPLSTRVLLKVAELFQNRGGWIFLSTLVAGFLFAGLTKLQPVKPLLHGLLLQIPVVKEILKKINLERFTRILGTLLESGMPLDQSLRITVDATNNQVYKKAIAAFIPVVEKGSPLAEGLKNYPVLFPKLVTQMIAMGERTGNLEHTLNYLNEFYESEVDNTMKNLSTILEPALLIFIGLIVGGVAISILGPIYKITGNLRG